MEDKDYDLFSGERALIKSAQDALAADVFPDGAGRDHFETLLNDFEKLLKQFRRLIRMSDRNEAELNRLKKSLEAQAVDLKDARDVAEAATRAKDTFLATMSHEIRTPMNGVIGMIDLLRETRLDGDQRQMLGVVRDSAFSLLTIINDILDFSKIEAGKLELENIPVSIADLVDGVAETLLPNASKKELMLIAFVDPSIPETVLGDQVRIRQILFNLAGNAIKFTQNRDGVDGKVIMRADRTGDPEEGGVTVRYSLTDTGIGISEEAQKSLFEEFTQAESSTTRQFGGTGLGLSICQRLTELMDGVIAVDSTLGIGSTFSATIRHDLPDAIAGPQPGPDVEGLNVLLVSGTTETRDFLSDYLRHWKARTTSVEDPSAARAAIEGSRFDVVVLSSALDAVGKEALRSTIDDGSGGPPLVVLNQGQRTGPRWADPGAISIAADPVRRRDFLTAVTVAAGRADLEDAAEDADDDSATAKAPTVEEAAAAGQLILVAEDNPTNRDVIRRQLKVLGYAANIVEDGRQAFDAWQANQYALLLTDCQMPEMDGFALTAAIRSEEERTDVRLPIIAITANALEGEADRCLSAGMDDYLSKPVEMPKLKETLKQWMPVAAADPAGNGDGDGHTVADSSPITVSTPNGAEGSDVATTDAIATVVDPNALKSLFGDDDQTVREILADFVDPSLAIVAEIDEAVSARSAAAIASSAHKLKSSSRSVGAYILADLCVALEEAGKSEDWSSIGALAPRLGDAMQDVRAFIKDY